MGVYIALLGICLCRFNVCILFKICGCRTRLLLLWGSIASLLMHPFFLILKTFSLFSGSANTFNWWVLNFFLTCLNILTRNRLKFQNFSWLFSKIYGSRGTHWTHADGAPAELFLNPSNEHWSLKFVNT